MNRNELPDAFLIMYSVIDKTSFKTTEDELARLQNWDALRSRALIVVGNKIDLVRSRAVSTQGKLKMYTTHRTSMSGLASFSQCLFTF
jgi:GTPase SAR1 family protein